MSIKAYFLGVSSQPSFDGLKGCDDLGRVPELLDRPPALLGLQAHVGEVCFHKFLPKFPYL